MDDLKDLETNSAGQSNNNMGASGAGGQGRGGTSGLQYSIPGILHFLQHEWARFEMERGQWEVERAELQVSFKLLYIITYDYLHKTYFALTKDSLTTQVNFLRLNRCSLSYDEISRHDVSLV